MPDRGIYFSIYPLPGGCFREISQDRKEKGEGKKKERKGKGKEKEKRGKGKRKRGEKRKRKKEEGRDSGVAAWVGMGDSGGVGC